MVRALKLIETGGLQGEAEEGETNRKPPQQSERRQHWLESVYRYRERSLKGNPLERELTRFDNWLNVGSEKEKT